jgi:5-methylcytosine-specific restriction protein A
LDLKGDSTRAKAYGETIAFYKTYSIQHLPDEETLLLDFRYMISLYDQLPFLGGADLMEEIENAPVDLEEKKRLKIHQKFEGRANTKAVKKIHGYQCQVCNFDFERIYGELGKEYIEAHHLIPYADLEAGKSRRLDPHKDFAVLCSNCHRMIHKMSSPADLQKLREIIQQEITTIKC